MKIKCPLCGRLTDGAWSEGGVHFAVCPDCYRREYTSEFRRSKNEQGMETDGKRHS